ncbi:MAG: hypothetical protein WD118_06510 [Phycisphaeraceae bacterium]
MNFTDAEQIAHTLLYEGYLLYPYRPSAIKNRYRWTFGVLHAPAWSAAHQTGDSSQLQVQCLVSAAASARIAMSLRFLHVGRPTSPAPDDEAATPAHTDAAERHVDTSFDLLASMPLREIAFTFPSSEGSGSTTSADGPQDAPSAPDLRRVSGRIVFFTEPVGANLIKLTIRVHNTTATDEGELTNRADAVLRAMVSCQLLLGVTGGEWISSQNPPSRLRAHAEACENVGLWPVLIGAERSRRTLLCAPVILLDHPQVAPESPTDWFDATEIDELLALRVHTLTQQEKRELSRASPKADALLQHADAFAGEAQMQLHGVQRSDAHADGSAFSAGDRVRLQPHAGADAMDVIFAGMHATVETVEYDREGQCHITVTIDEDPGRDLGKAGKPGHRFFFRPGELQKLERPSEQP